MVTHATSFRYLRPETAGRARRKPVVPAIVCGMSDATEVQLQAGEWQAVVSSFGASLRGVTHAGQPVVTGYHGAAAKQGGQGDVLIPFPGRVKGGSYEWDGIRHQLPLTDKDGPNAIHGFVRNTAWVTEALDVAAVTYRLDFTGAEGYPFPLTIRLRYALDVAGLHAECAVTNAGAADAPAGIGFHPYFTVGSTLVNTDMLTLPFAAVLEFEQLIPTGRVSSVTEADLDFRTPRQIGTTRFNHCFSTPTRDASGRTTVTLQGPLAAVHVWMDESFGHVVIYTGDALADGVRRASIAIEPMTCATDALNHPAWGLLRLRPGDTHVARWGVRLTTSG